MATKRFNHSRPDTLAKAIEIYLETQNKADRTVRTIRSSLNRMLDLFDGDLDLQELRGDDLIDFKASLDHDDLAWETVRTYMAFARSFFKWLILRQWVQFGMEDLERAMEIIKGSNGRRPAPLPKLPDEEAIEAILTLAHERANTPVQLTDRQLWAAIRDVAALETLRSTGVRVQELVDMKFQDVHLADGYIIVPEGKGGKERLVFLDEKAKHWMANWAHEHPDGRPECPVFIRLDHRITNYRTAMTTESVRRILRGLCSELGIKTVTPHQFRHRFGTAIYVASGLGAAADLLGHKDTNVTRVYAKLARKQMQGIHAQAKL